jgi:hypothetical protein
LQTLRPRMLHRCSCSAASWIGREEGEEHTPKSKA